MANTTTTHHTTHDEHAHHVSPLSLYYKTFAALIALTILTVFTSLFDFGMLNIVVALAIAVTKAALVAMFFMQLKWDDVGNKVTFMAAFAFLVIFIVFTGADLFFRHNEEPVKVAEVAAAGGGETDQNKLRIATPAAVSHGKEIFSQQCAMCHGAEGKGDGAAAAALNPKPRNFTSGYWKFGGSPTRVFHTITTGSPGTAMPPFSNLSVADRYALAHYVRSLSPNHPDDTTDDLKAAGLTGSGPGPKEAVHQEIPIETAMEKMETPDQVIVPNGPMKDAESAGAKLYAGQCMKCHGVNGVGATVRAIGVNPTVNLITKSWQGLNSGWVGSEGEFVSLVSQGLPGHTMPGFANFTKDEWGQLYSYAKGLTH